MQLFKSLLLFLLKYLITTVARTILKHSIYFFIQPEIILSIYINAFPRLAKRHLQLIVDMILTYSKEQIAAALNNSFIGDSKKLKETADYLNQASKLQGYCMKLMEIVDEPQYPIELKQAALVQLKNTIRMKWKSQKYEINVAEKDVIKNTLLLAIIRCAKNSKIIKLYRQVFTSVVSHQYKTWLPVSLILQKMQSGQNLPALMHALLGIASSFEFTINQEERLYFFDFLKVVLPKLLQLVQKNIQNSQLVYLNVKFLWKAVHYQINQQLKLQTIGWMQLIQSIVSLTNQTYETGQIDQYQPKDTPQFYYFHSKKWATRILLRFIQKHAKKGSLTKSQDNKEFSEKWYRDFGQAFINGLMNQFIVPTTKKIRYFQLKCVHSLIAQHPEQLKKYAETFQYDILINYLRLQPDDQELAQRDPVQFISKQQDSSMNYTNLKKAATQVWIDFANLNSRVERKKQQYQPGTFFYANMNYLQSKLEAGAMIDKELAMYLICELRSTISKCKPVKSMLPMLITKYVIPEFKNEIMFLRARAVDIYTEYGNIEFDSTVIKMSVQGIYHCLMNDAYPLVRIKAASAFNCILKHKSAKELVRPLLKDILTVYLQLLQKYDLQSLVNSLESIVQDFSSEIGPFAYDLTIYLTRLFFKLFNRDAQQANKDDYDGEAQLAAAGCLKTLTQIIECPLEQQVVIKLEPQIIGIMQFIFGQSGTDYIEDALILLNCYLFKVQKISTAIWFYYQVTIYNMVGIPKEWWGVIDQLPLSQKQRQIIKSIKGGQNLQMIDNSMPVLRNYISKGSILLAESQDAFQTNLIQLLFYLINQIYKRGPQNFGGQTQMMSCTALLIYLLQNCKDKLSIPIYQHIWQISKYNMTKTKSKILKTLNSQLLALLIWADPIKIYEIVSKDNFWTVFINEMIGYEVKYEQDHERIRAILGLTTVIALPNKNQEILAKIPQLFKTLIKMVKKSADNLLEDDPDAKNINFEDDDDNSQQLEDYDFQDDDDEDFWQEQYDDNYSSKLDEADQIGYFKSTIESISQTQPLFYSQLMKTVSQEELNLLADKIKRALTKVQNLNQNQ